MDPERGDEHACRALRALVTKEEQDGLAILEEGGRPHLQEGRYCARGLLLLINQIPSVPRQVEDINNAA